MLRILFIEKRGCASNYCWIDEPVDDLLGEGGILKQLTKALVEGCLEGEMKTHIEEQRAEVVSQVRRAKLGFVYQVKVLILKALARHQVPSVA